MKISFIGTGYVGLVSGTCLAELGNNVTCLDSDNDKILALNQGLIPIYEEGLGEIVQKNRDSGNLKFSSDVENEIKTCDIVFIAVGTPSNEDGSANLTYVFAAAETIAKNAKDGIIIITKSTVPVGTGDKIAELVKKTNPTLKFYVASNPEFLREGSAIKDFMNPDRILIGANSDDTYKKIAALYKKQTDEGKLIIRTDIRSAELSKYAANAYLATRVAFINEISDLCEKSGADIDNVTKAIGSDKRIGSHFLQVGPGFGGSCFPKDTRAISSIAKDFGFDFNIINAVIKANDERQIRMADKIISACDGNVKGKNIAILGTTFKANTDDIRESPALKIIEVLAEKGANLFLFDPQGLGNTRKYFESSEFRVQSSENSINHQPSTINLNFCPLVAEALMKAESCAILTEWSQFKNINYSLYKNIKTVVDLRNLLDPTSPNLKDIKYIRIGS